MGDEDSLRFLETNPLLCFDLKPDNNKGPPFTATKDDLVDLVACLH